MFRKTLPVALTFFVSSAQLPNQQQRVFDINSVPQLFSGDTFTLTISISAKATSMPQIDQIKIELIGTAVSRRETQQFYHREIPLPQDIQCLEIPLQENFPISSVERGKCSIKYCATISVKGKQGEISQTAKFEYSHRYAPQYKVPQIVYFPGYDVTLECENVILLQNEILRGCIVGEQNPLIQQINGTILTTDADGKYTALEKITICDGLTEDVSFELPLAGFQLQRTINWFGVLFQTFLQLELVAANGTRDLFLAELIII